MDNKEIIEKARQYLPQPPELSKLDEYRIPVLSLMTSIKTHKLGCATIPINNQIVVFLKKKFIRGNVAFYDWQFSHII